MFRIPPIPIPQINSGMTFGILRSCWLWHLGSVSLDNLGSTEKSGISSIASHIKRLRTSKETNFPSPWIPESLLQPVSFSSLNLCNLERFGIFSIAWHIQRWRTSKAINSPSPSISTSCSQPLIFSSLNFCSLERSDIFVIASHKERWTTSKATNSPSPRISFQRMSTTRKSQLP